MVTLKFLKLAFTAPLAAWEIPAFHLALANFLGGFQQADAYPLLQCKTYHNKGRQQALTICMGGLAEELIGRLPQLQGQLQLPGGRLIELKLADCRPHVFDLQLGSFRNYQLFNYQPFNQLHYREYQRLTEPGQQLAFLNEQVRRHLHIFAAGIQWPLPGPIEAAVIQIRREKPISSRGIKVQCFDLDFRCNLFLPEYIGLGRGAAKGFGVVRKAKSGVGEVGKS